VSKNGPRIPARQRATKKLQIYVTPYTYERLKSLQNRTGKAASVLARRFIEEGLGLARDRRAASARSIPREQLEADEQNDRIQQIMAAQGVSEVVARRLAKAERR
jgi:predicted DNA-binding protein